ncbi:MAG: hypothetical protein NVV66_16400 [Cellulomonas sp.]|uniref:hypothetical protein n=1 Tax=Cellulomonas sp. TaxID=40001 RepID=UPI002590884B|nr:hypothetical protein [Cellulomonas sp.]MCR6706196.1 hypothetical protein [Cellulomonas sp.]
MVAPPAQDAKSDPSLTGLVVAILRHPACPPAVAARYVGHPSADLRRLVLNVDGVPAAALEALSYDPDPGVAQLAKVILAGC